MPSDIALSEVYHSLKINNYSLTFEDYYSYYCSYYCSYCYCYSDLCKSFNSNYFIENFDYFNFHFRNYSPIVVFSIKIISKTYSMLNYLYLIILIYPNVTSNILLA